jgi:hypothetical protein
MKLALAFLIGVAVVGGAAADQEMITRVIVKRLSGEGGVGMEVRANPAVSGPLTYQDAGSAMFFTWNHNVKDAKGRIVTGLAFRTWAQGKDARVEVFTLVPRPGAPNQYYATGGRGSLDYLEPIPFAQFTIAVGGTRNLDEMKTLGLDPLVVTCAREPKSVR